VIELDLDLDLSQRLLPSFPQGSEESSGGLVSCVKDHLTDGEKFPRVAV
jgi:hypothetical protein